MNLKDRMKIRGREVDIGTVIYFFSTTGRNVLLYKGTIKSIIINQDNIQVKVCANCYNTRIGAEIQDQIYNLDYLYLDEIEMLNDVKKRLLIYKSSELKRVKNKLNDLLEDFKHYKDMIKFCDNVISKYETKGEE